MKKLKIFPKMFIQIFSVLGIIIILVHSLVYFIFPKTYLETRKEKIHNIANEISGNMNGKEIKYIEQTLELYSKSSEIKAFIKEDFPLFVFPNTPICRRFADGVSFHVAPICVLLLVRFAESVIISTVYDHFVSDTFHAARHTVPALCRLISRTDFIII